MTIRCALRGSLSQELLLCRTSGLPGCCNMVVAMTTQRADQWLIDTHSVLSEEEPLLPTLLLDGPVQATDQLRSSDGAQDPELFGYHLRWDPGVLLGLGPNQPPYVSSQPLSFLRGQMLDCC